MRTNFIIWDITKFIQNKDISTVVQFLLELRQTSFGFALGKQICEPPYSYKLHIIRIRLRYFGMSVMICVNHSANMTWSNQDSEFCNYLHFAVCKSLYFALQLPTFLFYNKHCPNRHLKDLLNALRANIQKSFFYIFHLAALRILKTSEKGQKQQSLLFILAEDVMKS